jgi:hypothetical protein
MRSLIDRLGEKLKAMPSGCWEFQGSRLRGYGRIGRGRVADGTSYSHRVMWEIVFGSIPDGLCVLHKCDNPPCGNPAHLFLGTNADNTLDKERKGRGRHTKGEENADARLTWGQVRAIRVDSRSCRKLATEYGVCHQHIQKIKSGKKWKE